MPDIVLAVPIHDIRISPKQERRVSWDRIERHRQNLENGAEDLHPIDGVRLHDGTVVINGNGRHRYFAYREAGFSHVLVSIKKTSDDRPHIWLLMVPHICGFFICYVEREEI